MARTESDKEDLIADATALVERAEFCHAGRSSTQNDWQVLTVGFRDNGSLSLYFDQDPFYQFDANGLLRRGWESGYLYRSEGDTLAKLDRQRSGSRTTLERSDLTQAELTDFRQRMRNRVSNAFRMLESGAYTIPRKVSDRGDIEQRTTTALAIILNYDDHFLAKRIAKRKPN